MKNISILFLGLMLSIDSNAQTLFQNIYADSTWEESTMAASPDAYYLIQNGGSLGIESKLMKIDLNGNLLWSKIFSGNPTPYSLMRILHHNNSVIITGAYQNAGYFNFVSKLDTSGNTIWSKQLDYGDININTRIIPLPTGYLLCGHRDYLESGIYSFDITLTRIDDGGNLVWAKAYGNTNFDFTCAAAAIDSNNELVIAGNYGSRMPPNYDPLLARFDTSGNMLWLKTFSDSTNFFTEFTPTDITATTDGNFALTGFSKNTNSNFDSHLIKIDGQGNFLFAKRLHQISWQEYGNSIICDSQNNLVIAGPYYFGNDYGDFSALFDLAGNYIGAISYSKTSRGQAVWFNDIYRSRGGDLFERAPLGYAYSTFFYHAINYNAQCVVTMDYIGTSACPSLVGSYPFTIADITWSTVSPPGLPGFATNISSNNLVISTFPVSENQTDICTLVGVNDDVNYFKNVVVYPNPAAGHLQIEFDLYDAADAELNIHDVTGRVVLNRKYSWNSGALVNDEINVSAFRRGIYSLEIVAGKYIYTKKLVLQ